MPDENAYTIPQPLKQVETVFVTVTDEDGHLRSKLIVRFSKFFLEKIKENRLKIHPLELLNIVNDNILVALEDDRLLEVEDPAAEIVREMQEVGRRIGEPHD